MLHDHAVHGMHAGSCVMMHATWHACRFRFMVMQHGRSVTVPTLRDRSPPEIGISRAVWVCNSYMYRLFVHNRSPVAPGNMFSDVNEIF